MAALPFLLTSSSGAVRCSFSISPAVWAKERRNRPRALLASAECWGRCVDYPVMITCRGVMILVIACPSRNTGWWRVPGPVLMSTTIVACSEGR
jgi:hypothetical protein